MEFSRHYLIYFLIYFLGLAVIEIVWHVIKGRRYAWKETALSLVIQAVRRIVFFGITTKISFLIGGYLAAHALFDLPIHRAGEWRIGNAIALFFGVEFLYYWFHRWSHEIRWMWATHSVHHSPNEMNVLTAERLGWSFGLAQTTILVVPLVLLGFQPKEVGTVIALNLLYQYWLHTEMIPRLGCFEWFFNTPAHHRIHHASNVKYLDANYGGVIMIWDRMFGTLIEERPEEKIVFGLLHPIHTYNPLKIVFNEWISIAVDLSKSWRQPKVLLGFLFGPPGWSPDGSRKTSKELREDLGKEKAA